MECSILVVTIVEVFLTRKTGHDGPSTRSGLNEKIGGVV